MSQRMTLTLLVVLLAASVASAQIPMPFHIIPISGKTRGDAGTDWVTDLTVGNYSDVSGTVGISYFPAGRTNTFNGTLAKQIPVPAHTGLFYKDVVGTLFPEQGNATSGFLLIADSSPPHCNYAEPPLLWLTVASRTYNNADPSKTYGQTVPSALLFANPTTLPSIITGVRHQPGVVPGFRSNIGIVNISTITIGVTVTGYRIDGTAVGSARKTVEPLTVRQWSLSDFGIASIDSGGVIVVMDRANVKADLCDVQYGVDQIPACLYRCQEGCGEKYAFPDTGAFIAYVSKVDNGSGDAEFLLPVVDWIEFAERCGATIFSTGIWEQLLVPPTR
jgi:hypothetical protein